MKCDPYITFKVFILLTMLTLDFVLLSINNFFIITSVPNIQIGIKGIEDYGNFKSFDSFSQTCLLSAVPKEICSNISNLKSAGSVLIGLLSLDICVLTVYSILYCIQYYTVHTIVSAKLVQQRSFVQKCVIKSGFYSKFAIISHPVIVNLGCGLWVEMSRIEEFSTKIKLNAGVGIVIVQCFCSLLVIAMFFWEVSAGKRKVARLKLAGKSLEVKSESVDFDQDSKSFEVPKRV